MTESDGEPSLKPPTKDDEAIQTALHAALTLSRHPLLQQDLRDPSKVDATLAALSLPRSATAPLLDLVNRFEVMGSRAAGDQPATGADAAPNPIRTTLLEPFEQIRWSFWTLFVMSLTLFVVGLVFLGLAIARSITEGSVSTPTLTIAGLGVADIVVLFYARPWQDIAKNVANSERARIVAMSYPVALALLQRGATDEFLMLERLTKESVDLLRDGSPPSK